MTWPTHLAHPPTRPTTRLRCLSSPSTKSIRANRRSPRPSPLLRLWYPIIHRCRVRYLVANPLLPMPSHLSILHHHPNKSTRRRRRHRRLAVLLLKYQSVGRVAWRKAHRERLCTRARRVCVSSRIKRCAPICCARTRANAVSSVRSISTPCSISRPRPRSALHLTPITMTSLSWG